MTGLMVNRRATRWLRLSISMMPILISLVGAFGTLVSHSRAIFTHARDDLPTDWVSDYANGDARSNAPRERSPW